MPDRECPAVKSPSAGMRLDNSGELHPVMQQTVVDYFSHTDCAGSLDQGGKHFFRADVGGNPKTFTPQVIVPQVARLLMSWQQQRRITWSAEQNKQFDPG